MIPAVGHSGKENYRDRKKKKSVAARSLVGGEG